MRVTWPVVPLRAWVATTLVVVAASASGPARAALQANLYLSHIDQIAQIGPQYRTDDDDSTNERTAAPTTQEEPFWVAAILQNADTPLDIEVSPFGTCDAWVHTTSLSIDTTLTAALPDRTEANFYVALFDYDQYPTVSPNKYYSELIGDHYWTGALDTTASGLGNNDASPYWYTPADGLLCGRDPRGNGAAGDWTGYFHAYYTDTDGPTAATGLVHSDADANPGYNNDDTMLFTWTPGADPNTGTVQLIRIERQSDGAYCEHWLPNATDAEFSFTGTVVCDRAGTASSLALDEGQAYRARISTRNGVVPVIDNPAWADSGYTSYITQDSQPPTTAITGPSATPWYAGAITVSVDDSGNAATCDYRVNAATSWTARTCDAPIPISIGAGGDCSTPGSGACTVEVRARTPSGATASASRSFSVDWVAEPVSPATLQAWATPAKVVPVGNGVWQPDGTPYLSWQDPTVNAALSAYERGFAAEEPDCGVLPTSTQPTFDQTTDLGEGSHLFWVRVRDVAGNCSPATAFDVRVDRSGDATGAITAYPFPGAPTTLPAATWQSVASPHFTWPPVTGGEAPITGYAVGWGTEPADCSVTQAGASFTVAAVDARPDGVSTFNVRALDAAGNCGPPSSFELWVDTQPPAVALTFPVSRVVLDIGDEVDVTWTTTEAHPALADVSLSVDGGGTFAPLVTGIPDTGSYHWVVEGPEATDARLRVTATDEAGLTGSASSAVGFRIRNPVPDHLVLTAASPEAIVDTPVDVALQVVDALSDPVEQAVTVRLLVDGEGEILDTTLTDATLDGKAIIGTTAADGSATVTVTSTAAEQLTVTGGDDLPEVVPHRAAHITFDASAADHLLALADDAVAPLGGTEPIHVQIVDRHGNPVALAVPISLAVSGQASLVEADLSGAGGIGTNVVSGTTGASGLASFLVRDFTAELVSVVPSSESGLLAHQVDDEATTISFADVGGVDPVQSRLQALPERVFADDQAVAVITVEPMDSTGTRVGSGLPVTVQATYGTVDEVTDVGDGTYTTTLHSADCPGDPAVVTADADGVRLSQGADVDFTCDAVTDAVLTADPDRIPGDGSRCASLTVTPLGQDGEPMPAGQAVQLFPDLGTVGAVTDDGHGSYEATYCSTECNDDQAATIDVSVNGVPLATLDDALEFHVSVLCIAVDAALSRVDVDPTQLAADGRAAATVLVTPVDGLSDDMGTGLTVTVASSLGTLTAVEDLGDGTYRTRLTATQAGVADLSASVGGVQLDARPQVQFLPAAPSAIGSTALTLTQEVLGGDLSAGGNATILAHVRSNEGFDIEGAYLVLTLESDLSLRDAQVRVGADTVGATDAGGPWRIDLGHIPARLGLDSDSSALEIHYELDIGEAATGARIASLQAFADGDDSPISEVHRLSIPIQANDHSLAGAEACGCSSADGGSGLAAGAWLLAVWAALVRRRRRAGAWPGRTAADPSQEQRR